MPGPRCSVCCHADAQTINYALQAGEHLKTLAEKHGLSQTALSKHRHKHMEMKVLDGRNRAVTSFKSGLKRLEKSNPDATVLERVRALGRLYEEVMAEERAQGRIASFINAGKELFKCLEVEGKMTGEIKDGGGSVTINQQKQFIQYFASMDDKELDQLLADGFQGLTVEGEAVALPS